MARAWFDNYDNSIPVAKITLLNGDTICMRACDEDQLADFFYRIYGDDTSEEPSGVPTFLKVSSWCTIAAVGEAIKRNKFKVEIIE